MEDGAMPLLMGIIFFLTIILQLIAFVIVLIRLFKKEGVLKGILGIIIGIYAFVWGWIKHKELRLTKVMLVWSVSIAAQIIIIFMGMSILTVWIQSEMKSESSALTLSQSVKQPAVRPAPQPPSPRPKPEPEKKAGRPMMSKQEVIDKMNNLNRIIDQDQANADAFYSRGWLYEYQGDLQNAINDYSKAIVINAQHTNAYYNRGLIYIRMNRFDQAVADFSKVLSITPASIDAYCNRGNAYFQIGQTDNAILDYTAALKLNPKDADIYFNRGIVFRSKGDQERAQTDFREAVQLGHSLAKEYLESVAGKDNGGRVPAPKTIASPKVPEVVKQPPSQQNVDEKGVQKITKNPSSQAFSSVSTKGRDTVRVTIRKPMPETPKEPAPAQTVPSTRHPIVQPPTESVAGEKTPTTPPVPSKVAWNMDPDQVVIPPQSVSGRIHGEAFTADAAKLEGGILTLSKGKDFIPDQATLIFLFLEKNEKPDGKVYHITRDQGSGAPHIHIKWRAAGKDVPDTDMFMRDYAMRLEFGRTQNGKIPGKIYLSMPDKMQSYMAGTFMAEVK
jgi:Tfp pilus assembly protein PilF